jgi:predicted ribosome quality control (RQC) complex YloA/Tae2 family protein
VISECFSQDKDELILRFETTSSPAFIKATMLPEFTCISFPENFHRARKNSVDLFEDLIGLRVQSIRQFKNERSFALLFDHEFSLVFKMHGNRANVILFQNNDVKTLFKNSITIDNDLQLNSLDREIDWSFDAFKKHQENPAKLYFTFGKIVWQYLDESSFTSQTTEEKFKAILGLKKQLENPKFYLTQVRSSLILSLLSVGQIQKEFNDPVKAINEYYYSFTQTSALTLEKNKTLAALKAKAEAGKNYIQKTQEKLFEQQNNNNYKVWADLIMANLHTIKSTSEKVTLDNFYNENKPTDVKLKKDITPQKNAEIYYKKSKNQQIEIDRLENALRTKENELKLIEEKIEQVKNSDDLKTIKGLKTESGLTADEKKQAAPLPYHEFIMSGYKIWVGRNAQNNDALTLKYSYKEDLWLHAKDVAGSHVLIKHQSGKNFPKDVIERAAQLAAYNSKRKNESLCPVIVTPKKFVRKRKGDPAGAVVVEREDVIMVEPLK